MQYANIAVGGAYAVVFDGQPLSEPLCVEVQSMDGPRHIKGTLLYPPIEFDKQGEIIVTATSAEIQGVWDDLGTDRDGVQFRRTWKAIAEEQWGRTLWQHELVQRLASFDILRAPKLYGGLPVKLGLPVLPPQVATSLNLTFEELDILLDWAEHARKESKQVLEYMDHAREEGLGVLRDRRAKNLGAEGKES